MTLEANKALVLRWVAEVLDQGNPAARYELAAEDTIYHLSARRALRGGAGGERTAFPDRRTTVNLIVAEDDLVVVRGTTRGTHLGTLDSPLYGRFPPTGKRVRWSFVNVYRVRQGKIIEVWEHTNWLRLLEQLGARIEAPPSSAEE